MTSVAFRELKTHLYTSPPVLLLILYHLITYKIEVSARGNVAAKKREVCWLSERRGPGSISFQQLGTITAFSGEMRCVVLVQDFTLRRYPYFPAHCWITAGWRRAEENTKSLKSIVCLSARGWGHKSPSTEERSWSRIELRISDSSEEPAGLGSCSLSSFISWCHFSKTCPLSWEKPSVGGADSLLNCH